MKQFLRATVALGASVAMIAVLTGSAHAFRMIQNTSVGRFSSGTRVPCSDPGGFAHWAGANVSWRYNPASQGAEPGVAAALQSAMASWTNIPGASHTLSYAGTSSAGFATDGLNVVHWGTGEGCSGGCLALTALVLAAGQVIVEADVTMNDAFNWNTNGSDYDLQAIAAHEFGHTLGVHHSDRTFGVNKRPTMYASYFGTAGRSLENDDAAALECSQNRYPPGAAALLTLPVSFVESSESRAAESSAMALSSRVRSGGALIRFRLPEAGDARVQLFDIAGREIVTLVNDYRAAGEYELAWDGGTHSGLVPSGIYFARLTTAQGQARASVILTR